MEMANLICETENCPNEAIVFGLNGAQKIRSCSEHIRSLMSKTGNCFDISGFNFISTCNDADVLKDRKAFVEMGRENLMILETSCETELTEALEAIEKAKRKIVKSIENRFEEMKVVVTTACSEAKMQLSDLRSEFDQYLSSKENQLSSTAESICSDMKIIPMILRFGIAEVSDNLSAILSDSWTIAAIDIRSTLKYQDPNEQKAAIESALSEAAEHAQRGISEALKYPDLLIGDNESFEKEKALISKKLLDFEKKRNERNLTWLQRLWNMKQLCNFSESSVISIGHQLARLLYSQLGKFLEAEEILVECLSIADWQGFQPEVSMLLSCEICNLYFVCGQYEKIIELGMKILEDFESANLQAEYYWTIVFYLMYSMKCESENQEAIEIVEKWVKQEIQEENIYTTFVRLVTIGVKGYFEKELRGAESCLQQARRIGLSNFPTSQFTALTLTFLALLKEDEMREQYQQQAQFIYEVMCPKSICAAKSLYYLALLLKDKENWREAEVCCQKAQTIFEESALKSTEVADNLNMLGDFQKIASQLDQAAHYYFQAQSILKVIDPMSTKAATRLIELADLLMKNEQWSDAEKYHREAQDILRTADPNTALMARSLIDMASVLNQREAWDESERCYHQARSILEITDPNSYHAALALIGLGFTSIKRDELRKAEEWFEKAQHIYVTVAPRSTEVASRLIVLGDINKENEQWSDAERCYVIAHSILAVADPSSTISATKLIDLGILLREKMQLDAAERSHRNAQSYLEVSEPNSTLMASNLSNLGHVFCKRENWDEADRCYKQAQSILQVVDPISTLAALTFIKLAEICMKKDQLNEAEGYLIQANSIFRKIDPKSTIVATEFIDLAESYAKKCDRYKINSCYRAARSVYEVAGIPESEWACQLQRKYRNLWRSVLFGECSIS